MPHTATGMRFLLNPHRQTARAREGSHRGPHPFPPGTDRPTLGAGPRPAGWALLAGLWMALATATVPSTAWAQRCETPTGLLTLQAALDRMPCHPLVRSALGRLQGARADEVVAGQRANPSVTVGANSIPRHGVGNGRFMDKAFDHQLRVDQAWERGDKRLWRQQAARQQQLAASADVQQAQADARADIASAFLDLRAAQSNLDTLLRHAEFNQQARRLIERRVQAGDAPALDLSRLQVDDARLQSDVAQARVELGAQRARLTVALGLSGPLPELDNAPAWPLPAGLLRAHGPALGQEANPAKESAASPAEPYSQGLSLQGLSLQGLLERRAEVRAAKARTEAAAQALRLAQSQRSRDVVLGVQANRYPATPVNPSGSGNTLSFTATVPWFLAHAFEGEIARAQADWELAQQLEAQTREAAMALIDQRRAERAASRQQLQVANEQLMPAAQQLARGAEAAYARGGTSMLEVLDARRALRSAERELIDAQTQAAKAELQWQLLDSTTP